eukprot:CAMPEP_0115132234 /NCGR_PEP_ID=MMETSP0227-20121206/53615_1 /TAXON_ID=89957 /ORGANISM="Polarella glacialis, Strain CCMP 1383" /LENGTH=217 /DNA_ID=CAMNT_0002537955 /DNA_START=71 /DNA_END=721 /DNA_ORIENTATION=-
MMPGMPMMNDAWRDGDAGMDQGADKMKQVVALKKAKSKDDEKVTTVFVGGLRKSTSEDKVAGHFARFGQVDSVDIKRLPDGTSRGFAFVKFVEKESVDAVVEAKASHMIDNKWVAVRPHGGTTFQASANEETSKARTSTRKKEKDEEESLPQNDENYEEKWSEKYLQAASAMTNKGDDEDEKEESASTAEEPADQNAMMMQMMQNPMMMMQMMQMMG